MSSWILYEDIMIEGSESDSLTKKPMRGFEPPTY